MSKQNSADQPWFKAAATFGVYPSSWQGWLVTLIFLTLVCLSFWRLHTGRYLFGVHGLVIALCLIGIVIIPIWFFCTRGGKANFWGIKRKLK